MVFVIAEVGTNHMGSIKNAKQIIDIAKDAGCDAVKFQKRSVEKVYTKIDSDEIIIEDNHRMTCQIIDDKIVCPIKYNRDGSSSFFPIDIYYLVKLWGSEIIISQKGFF